MKDLFIFVKKYKINIFMSTLSSIMVSLSSVYAINIIKVAINESINGTMASIYGVLFKILLAIIVGAISTYLLKYNIGYFSANILSDLKEASVKHLLKLPIDFVEKSNYGDLINRLSNDIESVSNYLSSYAKDVFYITIFLLVNLLYLISIDFKLAILCTLPMIICMPIATKLVNKVKKSQKEYMEKMSGTYNNIQEVCDGISTIKAYQLEEKIYDKYYQNIRETIDVSKRNDIKQYQAFPFYTIMSNVPIIIAIFYGGSLTFKGQLDIGILIAFVTVLGSIIGPVNYITDIIAKTKLAFVSVNRVFEILNLPAEDYEDKLTTIDTNEDSVFSLNNVVFSYGEKDNSRVILDGINLDIKRGEKVSFVGKSGCGKSTLLKLLYGHYSINSGDIKFFNTDYNSLAKSVIRDNISLISQDSFLFPMSILDNIKIGNREATYDEVISASKMANCHNFISEMPNGYDTFVGEKGSQLSGGQRQRIAIARAILENNEVLLLDEPTSALDRESEILVQEALTEVSKSKTVITIAHRLNTIIDSDKIIVIDEKKVSEIGTHFELIKNNGIYKAIYDEFERSAIL